MPEGGHHRGYDMNDMEDVIINEMGRSHSGGHGASYEKLPSITHHHAPRVSNTYPSVSTKAVNYGLGGTESLSRSPSGGLSGRVDWKSKYLK